MTGARLRILLLVSTLTVMVSSAVEAGVAPGIDSAGVYLMQQRYGRAKRLLDSLRGEDATDIHALYASFTVRQTEILDYESYAVYGDEFLRFVDSAIAVIESAMATGPKVDTVRCLFYLGNLHGGKSIILAKNDKWFRAIKPAMASVGMLRETKKRDPTFRAALLGVGLFNYYLSQNLGWMPFVRNRTEEGLGDIVAATKAEFPYNYAAMNTYCWIMIERGEYARADSLARKVLVAYPRNTIFLRIKTRAALMGGRHREALEDGRRLKEWTLAQRGEVLNWSDLLMAHEVMAKAHIALGSEQKALAVAREGLKLDVPEWARRINHVRNHQAYLEEVVRTRGEGDSSDEE
jgi:tetratricopeptide (TPR) repeat protein